MNYIELSLLIEDDFAEIMIAELAEIGFESFVETNEGVDAYIEEDAFDDTTLKQLLETYAARTALSYTLKKIEKTNWNEEWEKNFQPIEVADTVYVRADFHAPQPRFKYDVVITPKMSFGTGHHETTSMVMELQLGIEHQNKTVLDVGTGTGILGILASKLGASTIHSFDIDEWSVTNTIENMEMNAVNNMTVVQGTIQDETPAQYDIVLANINRNILLNEIPLYSQFIKPGGWLIVSGFYEKDIADIQAVAAKADLQKTMHLNKNQWAAVVFKRN